MAKLLPNGPRSEGILRSLQSFVVHEVNVPDLFSLLGHTHDSPISTYGDAILLLRAGIDECHAL